MNKNLTAASVVTGAAFVASAAHIVSVVDATNSLAVALVYPLGIDGLIFVGIRAMQTGRKGVGALALFVGAVYSMLFNAHAENALTMHPGLIATSMPICFFAAVLIEATAPPAKPLPETVREPDEWELMRERVEARIRAEHVLEMEAMRVEFSQKLEALTNPEPVKIIATVDEPGRVDASTGRGRAARWDVEKVVRFVLEGRMDVDVLAAVDGLTAKPLQRTRRAIKILADDPSTPDAKISEIVGQSEAHIARVRAAMQESGS